jgi:hypothetical protein
MFSEVRTSGDLWEFQQLVPYVLPTELDRLVGGKHYLSDPQRMKDANSLIEYAAELLYRRLQTVPPSNMSPELVSREYFIWRNLLAVFNDLKPESVWLVNMRLRQLTAVRPQSASGPTEGPWSEERLKKLIAAAKTSFGDTRDQYLDSAGKLRTQVVNDRSCTGVLPQAITSGIWPGLPPRSANAFSVELFSRSYPGLYQPWAGIS